MSDIKSFFQKEQTGWLAAGAGAISCLYWILGRSINVYQYAVVGLVFELLWLPMIISILVVPLLSVSILFMRNTRKLLPLLALMMDVGTVLYLIFDK